MRVLFHCLTSNPLNRRGAVEGLEDPAVEHTRNQGNLGTFMKVCTLTIDSSQRGIEIHSNCLHLAQGPTAPEDVYQLLIRFLSMLDKDAVVKVDESDELVRHTPCTIPGVSPEVFDECVKDSHVRCILVLPFQDMKAVLQDLITTPAIALEVRRWYFCI